MVYGINFQFFVPDSLFSGKFKGVDLNALENKYIALIKKLWATRIIGKPIDMFANKFKTKRLKMPI
jgi:hypothetical protein